MAEKSSGRFTPKKPEGGLSTTGSKLGSKPEPKDSADSADDTPAYEKSGRYTAPRSRSAAARELEKANLESPPWVAWLMFLFFGIGLVVIVCNYMFTFLPQSPNNWYLLGGLGAIIAGFITATRLR